ncbi:hypothetical protein [Luteolibacter soli]|uniref:hypothetical protein n=1 Tax=Luteolibacter soli TaxID=3135280 RepID=UPI00311967F2
MSARPIYRWKSFWLVVMVLGFLGWAWVRSMGYFDRTIVGMGGSGWSIELESGKVTLAGCELESSPDWVHGVSHESYDRSWSDDPWFPPAIERMDRETKLIPAIKEDERLSEAQRREMIRIIETRNIFGAMWSFACWFFMLLVLVPWGLLMAWRWRRIRRLTGRAVGV